MTRRIRFPGRGVGHMDVTGDIPIGPARSCGEPGMPPVIGDSHTVPALGDLETPP